MTEERNAEVTTEATEETAETTETVGATVDETSTAQEAPPLEDEGGAAAPTTRRQPTWSRIVAFALLPALALILALGAGYLKWQDNGVRNGEIAAATSMQAARDGTVALLSYTPDKVEQQLGAARDLLTGQFRDSYTSLTNDVVIPGAKQKQIAAVATVPAAASVSATPEKAVVLVFVNQTVTVGNDAPTDTNSSVRVTLEKVGTRWLISEFDPV
ncbi:hypothetical protein [Mycobacterium sp. PSTR-4-N]|uniref:hypothetical protein n=1 Tax=Mycobacterium sp. PSTR-4-N TaxID=2917745 RepID=UPI001F14C6B9|nr:hypothetical protein [Mycobacterium sp. PSTR-4-N]MCG7597104.1 hypothetical protein [Mycobacterium sp. PSTR-4-N]